MIIINVEKPFLNHLIHFVLFPIETDDCGDKGIFIIFKNGIVLQVTNRDMRLRALIMVPRSIMESDMFEGLLGDGDGDPDNDDRPFTPQNDGQGYMATSDTDIQSCT